MKKLLALILALVLCLAVFAACDKPEETTEANEETTSPVDEGLTAAVDYVHQLYKDIAEKTGANYNLITKLDIEGVIYTIEWTVSSDKVQVVPVEGKDEVTISVPQDALEDIPYTLTATVKTSDGKSATKSYEHIVPKFQYSSFADYVAVEKGEAVVVAGVVTGIVSKATGSNIDGLYLQDLNGEGGYYIYGISEASADVFASIKIGMTVEARGNKDNYNGTLEVKDASVKVLDSTIKTVTPVDFTTLLASATSLSDEALVGKQGMLVTVKGVTVLEAGDNGYYYFQAGEHKVYLRISSSANPCTKEDLEAVKTAHTENYGNLADVTGVISIYSGNFYLSPVSAEAFNNFTVVEKTPAEKVAIEKAALTFTEKVNKNAVIELMTKGQFYEDVIITWASNNAAAVVGENGLTVTLGKNAVSATITATITCGEATETVEFALAIAAKPTTSPVAIETPTAGTAYKVYMVHPNAEKNGISCYLTGKAANKEYYLATTEDSAEAADIFAEATEGGFHLYLMDGEKKVYLNIRQNDKYVNNLYEETAQCVYTWDATLKTFVTTVGEDTYTFGMKKSSTYTTIEAKKVTATDCAFVQFVTMVEAGPQIPASLTAGTPYYIYMVHPNEAKEGIACYLTGKAGNKDYYLATTDSVLDAAGFILEATEGGFHVYFMDGDKKVYLNIRQNDKYVNNLYEETAQCVYTWDATLKTLVTTVGEDTYTFGMKKTSTYTTIEAKKVTATDCAFANFVVWVGELPEAEVVPDLGTVAGSVTFTDYAKRTSYDKDTAEVWTSGDLKITHTKGSTALRDTVTSEDKQLRVYGNATLTVESTGIKKIVLVVDDSHSDSIGRLSSFSVEGATTEVVDGKAVITLPAAVNSVVITNTNTSQIRILSVEIYK